MLRAREKEGLLLSDHLGAFWRTFGIALAQSFFIQEVIKVLLICFISPPFFSRILRPNTKRAQLVRLCMRAVFNTLRPFFQ